MSSINIEKGIPIPKITGSEKYPFSEMDVGDSFSLPESEKTKIRSAAHAHGKSKGKKFITKVIDGNIRCWRIK